MGLAVDRPLLLLLILVESERVSLGGNDDERTGAIIIMIY